MPMDREMLKAARKVKNHSGSKDATLIALELQQRATALREEARALEMVARILGAKRKYTKSK